MTEIPARILFWDPWVDNEQLRAEIERGVSALKSLVYPKTIDEARIGPPQVADLSLNFDRDKVPFGAPQFKLMFSNGVVIEGDITRVTGRT